MRYLSILWIVLEHTVASLSTSKNYSTSRAWRVEFKYHIAWNFLTQAIVPITNKILTTLKRDIQSMVQSSDTHVFH